jgi:histone H3/H4
MYLYFPTAKMPPNKAPELPVINVKRMMEKAVPKVYVIPQDSITVMHAVLSKLLKNIACEASDRNKADLRRTVSGDDGTSS